MTFCRRPASRLALAVPALLPLLAAGPLAAPVLAQGGPLILGPGGGTPPTAAPPRPQPAQPRPPQIGPGAPPATGATPPGTAARPPGSPPPGGASRPGQPGRPGQPAPAAPTPILPSGPDEVVVAPPPQRISNITAILSGLDKITGRITTFDVGINETVRFYGLEVTPRACYTRPATENPLTTGFLEVDALQLDGQVKRIFTGWMFAASPGLNAVEHPIYDVWLVDCKQTPPDVSGSQPLAQPGGATPAPAPAGTAPAGPAASVQPATR